MSFDLKSLASKVQEVAGSAASPVLLMLMGYISNVLIMLHAQGTANVHVRKISRILMFAISEYEEELRLAVKESPTSYDDKLIDEILEAVDEIFEQDEDVESAA